MQAVTIDSPFFFGSILIACEVHVKDIAVAGERDCRMPIKSISFGFYRRFPPQFCWEIDKISATAVGSRVPFHRRKH